MLFANARWLGPPVSAACYDTVAWVSDIRNKLVAVGLGPCLIPPTPRTTCTTLGVAQSVDKTTKRATNKSRLTAHGSLVGPYSTGIPAATMRR